MSALLSLFVLIAILVVAAQTRPTLSVETQFQRQEDHIESVDRIAQENKQNIQTLQARLAQAESQLDTYRGVMIGFGGLLSALQIIGLIGKKKEN